jgi:diguanylate cyclase (GGDEF)-like protein/PAS domain S-box-containing protein
MDYDVIKVLLIDDDEDDFVIIRDMLLEVENTHYKLEWVNNYEIAQNYIGDSSDYDIFLLDYRLGIFNGLELLKEIRKKCDNVPVILLTGQGDHNIDLEAMRLGASDYINKNEVGPSLLERSIRYAIERKKMEDELFQEKERAIVTLESIGDSVITTDIDGNITHLNLVAEKITGWENDEAYNMPLFEGIKLLEDSSRELIKNPVLCAVKEDKIVNLPNQTVLLNREGKEFSVEGTASPIHNRENIIIGVVLVLHDVTDNVELIRKITHQANHDYLTGLANRLKFEKQLHAVIDQTKTSNQEHAMFYLDLDQFKIVNDTCGHFAGDQLLKQITALIKQKSERSEIIARLGGDEFGIILKSCSVTNACKIADEICRLVKDYKFIWQGRPFNIGVSIGVVMINFRSADFNHIMRAADQACYIAKEKGGNRYHLYQDDDRELSKLHGEMQLMPAIAKAFEDNRFSLYFQPIVPVRNISSPKWFEILLRMFDEDGKKLFPNSFLSALQRYNMMLEIDYWVTNKFFTYFKDNYSNLQKKQFTFNINISGAALNDDYFLDFIQEQFSQYRVPPEQICFEITETIAIANFSHALQFMQNLKSIGCRFALDDFGSGLSSFSYLKHLPFDYLKIDGSFVKNVNESKIDSTMVNTINTVAHLMGIRTIAEFVESQAIQRKLQFIGVDYMQGYWIDKPAPLSTLDLN